MTVQACVTSNLVGGLGNQLFIVANLLAASRRCGIPAALLRVSFSSSQGPPRPVYWDSVFADLGRRGVRRELPAGLPEVIVPERSPAAPVALDPSQRCVYRLVGFFQSDSFFADVPGATSIVPERMRIAAAQHLADNYGAGHRVGLHVRRGDYMQLRDIFEVLEVDYYDKAVRQLLGKQIYAGSVKLLIFCEETREGETMAGYFRSKYAGLEVAFVCARNEEIQLQSDAPMPREVMEMLMLAECDDVVMANSSWSWWAAYLNRCPLRRVVAPSRWFVAQPYPQSNRLYCDDWILL